MNNKSPVFVMETMLHVRLARFDSAGCSERTIPAIFAAEADDALEADVGDGADLAARMCETVLEQQQPLLLKNLTELLQRAEPFLPEVEDALDNLKEAFLTLLRQRLAESGLDTDTRLVLSLDGAGHLDVADTSHPWARELDMLLARTPELEAAMREIARQSTLLRGIQDIENAVNATPKTPQDTSSSPCPLLSGLSPYHVCLRGALSHFY